MPYNILNPGSVEDAWNQPRSVFNEAQRNDWQQQQAQEVQQGLLKQAMQNYAGNVELSNAPQAQPVVPTTATQMATQGGNMARRKPTGDEYEIGVIDYLVKNKGYSYEDARELMAPRIAAYRMQEKAENRAMADNLIASMQNMDIASPEYRQAAFQLYRLDPQMGTFMLKEGVSPREQYIREQKLGDMKTAQQQKRDDAVFQSNLRFDSWLKQQGVADERQRRLIAEKVKMYEDAGYTKEAALLAVMGGGRRGSSAPGYGEVSKDDFKLATDGIKALNEEIAEGRLADPNFELSPEKQKLWSTYYKVLQKANAELARRNGVGEEKQAQQRVQINPNDYNSVGPFIQWAVKQNGGKFTPDLARAIRARLGFNPDDNSPNNFVNQIFQTHYKYSG